MPCLGYGRQSVTSESPSILNVSPETAVGEGLAIIKNNNLIKVNLNNKRVDFIIEKKKLKPGLII